MTRDSLLILALLVGAGATFHAGADDSHKHHAATPAKGAAADAALTEGEVRKVDKAAGKVTIKHGPIPKLDMPAMAMAYRVKDQSLLDQLKPGDKIRFDAKGDGGEFTVLRLEKLK